MLYSRKKLRIFVRYLASAVLVVGLLGVASCAEVRDHVEGYFGGSEAKDHADKQAKQGKEFPKLSDVPDAPRPASTIEDLDRLGEGLVADRDDARYTNESLRSRYAEDTSIVRESVVAENASKSQHEPTPQHEATIHEELGPAGLAEQRQLMETESKVGTFSSRLAEERRVRDIEPASEAVLRDPQESKADGRRVGITGQETTRDAAARHASERSGIMTISQLRAMFNEHFDSSGRSPYRPGELQQVENDTLLHSRALSPGSADDMIQPNDIKSPPLKPSIIARSSSQDSRGRSNVSFQAASVSFAVGSASLDPLDRAALKKVVILHRKYGGTVHVIGHSSQRTRNMGLDRHRLINFNLSLDRATAVSMELTRLGVPAEAVTVVARSDNEPLAHEYMPVGEAHNRRTDIYLEY